MNIQKIDFETNCFKLKKTVSETENHILKQAHSNSAVFFIQLVKNHEICIFVEKKSLKIGRNINKKCFLENNKK